MSGRILIVDGVATQRIVLRARLAAACYETVFAQTGAEALEAVRAGRLDLVLAASVLPDMSGAELCRRLSADPRGEALPVVVQIDHGDTAARLVALRAGAEDAVSRPVDEALLMARLRCILRARNADRELRLRDDTSRALGLAEPAAAFERPPRIALVPGGAGEEGAAARLAGALRRAGAAHVEVTRRDRALAPAGEAREAFVLFEGARGSEALDLLSELRARAETRHAAILYAAPEDRCRAAAAALDLGAADLLLGAPAPAEIVLRIQRQVARKRLADRQRRTLHEGMRAALTDPLTGLHNRRYAFAHLARLTQAAQASGHRFAVIVADIDHFKRINDRRGHAAGDAVLTELARRLSANLRGSDLVARIGGEEFLLAVPAEDLASARALAERLCAKVREQRFDPGDGGPPIAVTLSMGVTLGPVAGGDGAAVIAAADRALYAAKAQGRDRAICADTTAGGIGGPGAPQRPILRATRRA